MQFLSARTLLYLRVCFLATITFYCFKDPSEILTAGFVVLLGQAMKLPMVVVDEANPIFGVVGLAFGSMALGEIIPLFGDNLDYFDFVVPIRLFAYFILGIYSATGSSAFLCNNLTFVYAFFEIWFNFLIFNDLRDEKHKKVQTLLKEADERGEINLKELDETTINEVTQELMRQDQI